MVFTTTKYLIFFLIIFCVYYLVPKKKQWIVLLIANIYFYLCACTSFWHMLFIVAASIITYCSALILEKLEKKRSLYIKEKNGVLSEEEIKYDSDIVKKKKIVLAISIILTAGMLIVMKYTGFIFENINIIINKFNSDFKFIAPDFILPLGISFYTFMSIGYMVDVYKKECKPEKNFLKYFLYISYFPHILQGPIDRYKDLASKFSEEKSFDYENCITGLYRIVVGVFKKIVIADRLSGVISAVTGNLEQYYGINIFITIVLYAIQLYADFSGYMDIAIGCSKMLGIKIAENFNAPYFSKSVAEFWRRWHISLGLWFRNYIYIPLGGNRVSKLKWIRNISAVWLLTGIWHGPTWNFLLWGVYYGLILVVSKLLTPLYNKFYEKYPKLIKSKIYSLFQICRTFLFVLIGYILFSVENLSQSIQMLKNMFCFTNESLTIRALTSRDCKISLLMGIVVLLVLDICTIKNINIYEKSRKLPSVIRWLIYIVGIIIIAVFSANGGAQEFLYFEF